MDLALFQNYNVVSSKPCIRPSSRIKISFLLLSIYTDELILTSKIMTFLPTLPSGNENSEKDQIQYQNQSIHIDPDQHF